MLELKDIARNGIRLILGVWLFLAPAPGEAATDEDLAETWRRAHVSLPAIASNPAPVIGRWSDKRVQRVTGSLTADSQIPAVIYLHGCSGIGSEEESGKLFLVERGFAVFLPDSFARTSRRSNCNTNTLARSLAPESHSLRLEELRFAVDRVRALPWIDPRRIYVVGFSEGGLAAARYDRDDVAGVAIMSWHCDGTPPFRGLRIPSSVPILAVLGTDDPWYRAKAGKHCGEYFGERPLSRSLLIEGNGHSMITSPSLANAELAKRALLAFLNGSIAN